MIESAETIFNNWFFLTYLSLAFFAGIIIIEVYFKKNKVTTLQNILVACFSVIFILMFGLRDYDVGVDTMMYTSVYNIGKSDMFNEKGFNLYNSLLFKLGASDRFFIFSIAFIYLALIYVFLKRKQYNNVFLIFFCWVSLFFFKSMGINTIRQGIGCSIFLVGLTFKKNYIKYLFFTLAVSFHVSLAIVFLVFFVAKYFDKNKYAIISFILGAILSIINIPIYSWLSVIPGINSLVNDKFEFYSRVSTFDYKIGFRIDFFIFNLFFAIVGYYYVTYILKGDSKETNDYNLVYNIYLYLSGFFFIMFNSGYSDRYGVLSWMLIPLLLAPFFEYPKIKSKVFNKFTLLLVCFIFGIVFYKLKTQV
ncbi:EpsG family protein [Chryseobacterium bernardetii]|uniref:EpsG family protein n=1 Tax=Chryseobacterium bernardetii TaxID=1241978 RepID=UPI000F512538|nr:EpsG family protein [Chryseobacterium bernardetii]AZB33868.1 EpsG family protein [Chryseobacterium bernardetii]